MSSPYIPGISSLRDPFEMRANVAHIELRVKSALRLDALSVSSGYAIATNGEVYVGSTVEDCVKHIVTAIVTQGLEK